MKHIFKLFVVVMLLVVLLGACAPKPTEAPAAPPAEQPAAPAEPAAPAAPAEPAAPAAPESKEILIAYSQAELVNAWRVTNQKDMEAQAEKFGVKLISIDANQDASKQLADVENMLAQKPACLIVSPLESKASAPVVQLAEEAGVPLVIIDRTIEAEPGKGMYKTEITQSHVLSGKLLAEKTVELLTKKYGEPKGNVVHVQGLAGASPVIDANKGWDEVMAAYPNIKVVATADAGFTKDGGMKVMEDFLQRFPAGEIDVVRSDYSDMTMGALEAIKNAGRTELLGYILGEGGHYKAIEAVVAGDFARETQTPPYFGEKAIQSCMDILAGKDVPARQQVDIKVFDADKKEEAQKYLEQIKAAGLEF
ncbi:MAG: substrate-binding domain-containing protein [Anaerolineae bacterium]|nr:substrate-binding domain-containing protein [Anaerolineae bacterium]